MVAQENVGIRCMVMPLDQELMLLPGSLIAEVVLYSEPEQPSSNAPVWLKGYLPWRGLRVPLVSVESFINKERTPVQASNKRVAIIKTLDASLGFPFYALLSRDIPRLVSIEPEAVSSAPTDGIEPRRRVAAELLVGDERLMIPDIPALEAGLWAVLPA